MMEVFDIRVPRYGFHREDWKTRDNSALFRYLRSIDITMTRILLFSLCIALFGGCGPKTEFTTAGGVKVTELRFGTGSEVRSGSVVTIHYSGALENGTIFDASREKNRPLRFQVGTGEVIRGLEEGLLTMKQGGSRRLVIPPDQGYGSRGVWGVIPGDAVLIFTVDLISVEQPGSGS